MTGVPALAWFVGAIVVATGALMWLMGRANGYEEGYDAGRAASVDHLVDTILTARSVRYVDPPPYDHAADEVER